MNERPKIKRPWSKKGVVCAARVTDDIDRLLRRDSRLQKVSKSALIAEILQKHYDSQSN